MAEAGLIVYNVDGIVQIDSTYYNYTNAIKISVPTVRRMNRYTEVSVATFQYTGKRRIVAVKLEANTFVGLLPAVVDTPTTRTVEFAVWNKATASEGPAGPAPAGTLVTFYLFDEPEHVGSMGLQVFNASGKLVFSSESKYMRVIASWTSAFNPVSIVATVPMARDVPSAIVLGRFNGKWNETYMSMDKFMFEEAQHMVARKDGANIILRPQVYYTDNYASPSGVSYNENNWDCSIIAVDVSGY